MAYTLCDFGDPFTYYLYHYYFLFTQVFFKVCLVFRLYHIYLIFHAFLKSCSLQTRLFTLVLLVLSIFSAVIQLPSVMYVTLAPSIYCFRQLRKTGLFHNENRQAGIGTSPACILLYCCWSQESSSLASKKVWNIQ